MRDLTKDDDTKVFIIMALQVFLEQQKEKGKKKERQMMLTADFPLSCVGIRNWQIRPRMPR